MTLIQAVVWGQENLRQQAIESASLDARLLLCAVTGLNREDLIRTPDRLLGEDEQAHFKRLVGRRAAREPVAYLIGHREFWGLDLLCRPGVLIPRPDSETLIELALRHIPGKDAPLRILDLGTGTGALLLALLQELPQARGIGTDISSAAVRLARRNTARLGFSARASYQRTQWARGVAGRFDLVIANPPYVPAPEIAGLARDVRDFEPRQALAAGPDGLDAFREISRRVGDLLSPKGRVIVEIGCGQGAAVRGLFGAAGMAFQTAADDLNGIERALYFEKD